MGALASLAFVFACDLPTSLPTWTTSWELLAVEHELTTAELLPENVRVDPLGFAIDSFSVTTSFLLGDVCELCTCFDEPIPEVEITPQEWAVRLPSGVTEAQLLSGTARVVMTNHVGFDLLDDGQGGTGRIDVALYDRRTDEVVDEVALTGAWAPGDSLQLEFDLAGLRLHSGMMTKATGRTAGSGDCDVSLTDESGFEARVDLLNVVASSVSVSLSDATLALQPRSVDLPDALANRLRPDAARVALEVHLESRVPTAAELDLSVAPVADALFTNRAALHTPMVLPQAHADAPVDAEALYLLDLDRLAQSPRLHFAAHTRITSGRVVRLTGVEWLRYRLLVRAEVPSR